MTSQTKSNGILYLAMGACGIYFSYVIQSIFSQKLYNTHYQSNVEFNQDGTPMSHSFKHAQMLVWMSGLFCALFGFLRSKVTGERPNPITKKQSIILGILFAVNMAATNFSLLYVSYPTQVIAKNSRYLFVVLVGAFFSRVPKKDDLKLPVHKLYVALVITAGVLLFNLSKISSSSQQSSYPQQWKGYLLLLTSMVADSLFCDSQAYSKSVFSPTSNHLFTSANLLAFLLCIGVSVFSGNFFGGVTFVVEHPQCLKELIIVGLLQVTGQISIYYIVSNFKQHIFPLISATRKIITIVASIFIFNHTLAPLQWLAVAIVCAGMAYQVYEQVTTKKTTKTISKVQKTQKTKKTKKTH